MVNWKHFFDQSVKSDLITYDNSQKIVTGQEHNYTTGCLLDYPYFEKYYNLISTDLSKQQKLDPNPKAIRQINFTGNLEEDVFRQYFSEATVKILWIYFALI